MVVGNGGELAVMLRGRQRKTNPDDLRRQRRLVPAVERRHLDLAAIGAVASGLSAPAAAKSMHWSSSWSPMTRLLGSARTWGRVVNGLLTRCGG